MRESKQAAAMPQIAQTKPAPPAPAPDLIESQKSFVRITLDGKTYEIGMLTLRQIRDMGVGVASTPDPDPQVELKRSFDTAVAVITAGLSVGNPEMTAERIYSSTASTGEMWKAMGDILSFAGLTRGEGAGEASPEAP